MASEIVLGRAKANEARPYDFVKANQEYLKAGHHIGPGDLTRGPRSYTVVLSCIDSRASPEHWFDLKPNEVWSLRNGGGRANDPSLLRSLLILQALSEIKEIRVLHHKNCGGLHYTSEWVHGLVEANPETRSGHFAPSALAHAHAMATLPLLRTGEEASDKEIITNGTKRDVQFLRNHPLVKESVKVTGWYQDLGDGLIYQIDI